MITGKLLRYMKSQNSKIILVTYANEAYIKSAKALEKRARSLGFSNIKIFGPDDLTPEFIANNKETLTLPRGAGYWIWKPSIIGNVLNSIEGEQLLLYCDAGVMLKSRAEDFEKIAQDGLIHLWSPQSLRGSNNFWIDKRVWDEVVGVSEVSQDPHCWAGLILGKNNETFRKFIVTWLDLCQREHLLRPDSKEDYLPSAGLIGHRHDQSILNCLVHLDASLFNLHSFNSASRTSPVVIHRRGNMNSYSQALFTVALGRIYRRLVKHLPKPIRYFIIRNVTKHRRPYAPKDEIERHLENFSF